MNTICYDFHTHSVCEVYTFYGTFVFVLTAFMESGHSIIEMCGMGES